MRFFRLAPSVTAAAPRWAIRFAMACLCAGLAACGMFGTSVPKLRMGDVRIVAAGDANHNSPVVFAVVVVADPTLEQRLMNPEQKWFNPSADLAATYPAALQAYYCELTPGQEMRLPPALFDDRRAYAVFVFANLAGGERRARIEQWREGGVVRFAREGWSAVADAKAIAPTARPRDIACTPGSGLRPT